MREKQILFNICVKLENYIDKLEKELDYQKQARIIAENAVVNLTKENTEFKKQLIELDDEITKAKEIIKNFIRYRHTYGKIVGDNYAQAWEFLKEKDLKI